MEAYQEDRSMAGADTRRSFLERSLLLSAAL
jgi:hypothetical protein